MKELKEAPIFLETNHFECVNKCLKAPEDKAIFNHLKNVSTSSKNPPISSLECQTDCVVLLYETIKYIEEAIKELQLEDVNLFHL